MIAGQGFDFLQHAKLRMILNKSSLSRLFFFLRIWARHSREKWRKIMKNTYHWRLSTQIFLLFFVHWTSPSESWDSSFPFFSFYSFALNSRKSQTGIRQDNWYRLFSFFVLAGAKKDGELFDFIILLVYISNWVLFRSQWNRDSKLFTSFFSKRRWKPAKFDLMLLLLKLKKQQGTIVSCDLLGVFSSFQ